MIDEDIYSVTEFNQFFSNYLYNINRQFYVRGEISQYKAYPTAAYITIKDNDSSVEVVMFSTYLRTLSFTPEIGDDVLVRGRGDIYQKTGKFSLKADMMQKYGIGEILEKLQMLKEKWKTTYFAKPKRKPPFLVKNIFVITSDQGSVIRDIIKTRNIRNSGVNIYIIPAAVQGSECEKTVSNGINLANHIVHDCQDGVNSYGLRDVSFDNSVLIVARGGGSFEDLLPFSSEMIVKAIYQSELVVISSIGHETDEPLCDFSADIRASTPTQAVELCIQEINFLKNSLSERKLSLSNMMKRIVESDLYKFNALKNKFANLMYNFTSAQYSRLANLNMAFSHSKEKYSDNVNTEFTYLYKQFALSHANFISVQRHHLENKNKEFFSIIKSRLHEFEIHLSNFTDNFEKLILIVSKDFSNQFDSVAANFNLVSPYSILERGYSIISNEKGEIVAEPEKIKKNGKYTITFKNEKEIKVKISEVDNAD